MYLRTVSTLLITEKAVTSGCDKRPVKEGIPFRGKELKG
jgi:hypothetical protein